MVHQFEGQVERPVRVHTIDAIIDGYLRTSDTLRTLDDLNLGAPSFVIVHRPQFLAGNWSLMEGPVAISKASIQFVLELGDPPRMAMRQGTRFIRLGGEDFNIQGFVHVPPGGTCMARINQRDGRPFLAITSALVTGPNAQFAASFLAVNRRHIRFAQEAPSRAEYQQGSPPGDSPLQDSLPGEESSRDLDLQPDAVSPDGAAPEESPEC